MNILPGDALAHSVHGASARPRELDQQPRFRPDGAETQRVATPIQAQAAEKVEAARPPAPVHLIEKPMAGQVQRAMPRGSVLDITV
jgi:hypothetical protein